MALDLLPSLTLKAVAFLTSAFLASLHLWP